MIRSSFSAPSYRFTPESANDASTLIGINSAQGGVYTSFSYPPPVTILNFRIHNLWLLCVIKCHVSFYQSISSDMKSSCPPASILSFAITVIVQDASKSAALVFTVITATPSPTAVTAPSLTVATFSSEELH